MTAAAECGFEILPHPPYSPDMAPSDFYLFPNLKPHLRGSNEGLIEAIMSSWGIRKRLSILKG